MRFGEFLLVFEDLCKNGRHQQLPRHFFLQIDFFGARCEPWRSSWNRVPHDDAWGCPGGQRVPPTPVRSIDRSTRNILSITAFQHKYFEKMVGPTNGFSEKFVQKVVCNNFTFVRESLSSRKSSSPSS